MDPEQSDGLVPGLAHVNVATIAADTGLSVATVIGADAYLHDLQRDPARVRRLCGWSWLSTALHAFALRTP